MATFNSILIPASPTSATLFSAALVASTSTADITVGFRTIIAVSLAGATDATAAAGVHIRFGNATRIANAAATDFFIPPGAGITYFETGEEFDRLRLMSAGTPTYFIYAFTRN